MGSCPVRNRNTQRDQIPMAQQGLTEFPACSVTQSFFFILFICFHVFLPVINLKNEFPKCLCLCPREEVDPAACFREAVPEKHTEHVFGGGSVQL